VLCGCEVQSCGAEDFSASTLLSPTHIQKDRAPDAAALARLHGGQKGRRSPQHSYLRLGVSALGLLASVLLVLLLLAPPTAVFLSDALRLHFAGVAAAGQS